MDSVDNIVDKYPLLRDTDLCTRHPNIARIIRFLGPISEVSYEKRESFVPFDRLGIENIYDFLQKILQGHEGALSFLGAMENMTYDIRQRVEEFYPTH